MIPIPFQFGGAGTGTNVSFVLSLVSTILGLAVAAIAFQGYRRNRSRPMLFVALGFFFVFVAPLLLFVGFFVLPWIAHIAPSTLGTVSFVVGSIGEVSQILGLLCILYGLRMPLRR